MFEVALGWRLESRCEKLLLRGHVNPDLDAHTPTKGPKEEETFLSTGIPDLAVPRVSS